jgi:hypothetical protein
MTGSGPSRHLPRRRNLSAIGGIADARVEMVTIQPSGGLTLD